MAGPLIVAWLSRRRLVARGVIIVKQVGARVAVVSWCMELSIPKRSVVWGTVTPIARPDVWNALGARLRGSVLIRFSEAWWKERPWLDVLGCAVRFTRATAPSLDPLDDDQDLLLATVRVPATTLLAPLMTHVDDYLRNAYFGISAFAAPDVPKLKLRLRVVTPLPPGAATRADSLALAVAHKPVRLIIEARPAIPLAAYVPIAEVELQERVELDQDALSFDSYRAGRDLHPTGFVHAMRIPVYAGDLQNALYGAGKTHRMS